MTLAIEAGPDTAYQHMSTLTLTGESDTLSFSVPTLVLAMPGAFVEVEVRRA